MLYFLKHDSERGFIDLAGLTKGLMTPKANEENWHEISRAGGVSRKEFHLEDTDTGSNSDHVLDLDSLPSVSSLLNRSASRCET